MIPSGSPDGGDTVCSGLPESGNILRCHAADRYDRYRHGCRDPLDELDPRGGAADMTRSRENRPGYTPARTLRFGSHRFLDAVNAGADRTRRRDLQRLGQCQRMRGELQAPGSDRGGYICAIVDDEPAAGFILYARKRNGDVVELSRACAGRSQVERTARSQRVHDGRRAIDKSFGEHHARIGDCMHDRKVMHNGLYHRDHSDHRCRTTGDSLHWHSPPAGICSLKKTRKTKPAAADVLPGDPAWR